MGPSVPVSHEEMAKRFLAQFATTVDTQAPPQYTGNRSEILNSNIAHMPVSSLLAALLAAKGGGAGGNFELQGNSVSPSQRDGGWARRKTTSVGAGGNHELQGNSESPHPQGVAVTCSRTDTAAAAVASATDMNYVHGRGDSVNSVQGHPRIHKDNPENAYGCGSRILDSVRPPPIQVPFGNKNLQNVQEMGGISHGVPLANSAGTSGTTSTRIRLVRPDRIPIGNENRLGTTYLGATPPQSHFSTPMGRSEMPGARVNVIHTGGGGIVGMANPILAEALKSTRVPKFSGKAEDFGEFEKQWKMHLKLMYGASGGYLSDDAVLLTLRQYLDEASATMLLGKLGVDPNLSYYEFWEELRSKFLRDARATHRQNWRAVRLQISDSKITLQDWEKFQALYLARRALVEDWTDAEDQQYVFAAIPPQYQSRVLSETGKRRNGKQWVRIMVPPAGRWAKLKQSWRWNWGPPSM